MWNEQNRREKRTVFRFENLKERGRLEGVGLDRPIMLI
jgi:hypothetical protein